MSSDRNYRFITRMSIQALGFDLVSGYPGLFAGSEGDWFCSSRLLIEDWIRMLPVIVTSPESTRTSMRSATRLT